MGTVLSTEEAFQKLFYTFSYFASLWKPLNPTEGTPHPLILFLFSI